MSAKERGEHWQSEVRVSLSSSVANSHGNPLSSIGMAGWRKDVAILEAVFLSMQTAQGKSCSRRAATGAECGWFGAQARSVYLQINLSTLLLFLHKMG